MNVKEENLPPYADIIFCSEIRLSKDGVSTDLIGVYPRGIQRILASAPLAIPVLHILAEAVFAKSEPVESVELEISWRDRVVRRARNTESLTTLVPKHIPESELSRACVSLSLQLKDLVIDGDGELLATVHLNGKLLGRNALLFRFESKREPKEIEGTTSLRPRQRSKPAVPTLLLIPGEGSDPKSLFAIAVAYADAGLFISDVGKDSDAMEFVFPAVVCSCFAIELFLKFFVLVSQVGYKQQEVPKTHQLKKLWVGISMQHQDLICGMFRNPSYRPGQPLPKICRELFEQALTEVGDAPFLKWRYAHELSSASLMSHVGIAEVVDALGFAGLHVRRTMEDGRDTGRE